jgi:heme exporter protein A
VTAVLASRPKRSVTATATVADGGAGFEIRLENVSKLYGEVPALREVSLRIAAGSTVALLGPNGAGKSTLLQVISGLTAPTAGTVHAGNGSTTTMGVLTHKTMLYDRLTGRENLALHATLRGIERSRIETVLAQVDLPAAANRPVAEYSHGMRKRLALARALLHDPQLLILDEPFSGLDADSQARLWQLLAGSSTGLSTNLRAARTILFSSHDAERAAAHADRVLILKNGRVASDCSQAAATGAATVGLNGRQAVAAPSQSGQRAALKGSGTASFGRTVAAVLGKDLLVEWRGRTATSAMLMLAGLLATVLGMAFESLAGQPRVISGVLWVLITFAAMHGLSRSFAEDFRDDGLAGLIFSGADPAAIYLGKILSNSLLLLLVSLVAVVLTAVFFHAPLLAPGLPGLLLVIGLAVVGLTAVGGILTVIARHSRLGESFLPILFLPLAVPVLLAGIEATAILLETGLLDGRWLRLLALYDVGMVVATAVFFEYTMEG